MLSFSRAKLWHGINESFTLLAMKYAYDFAEMVFENYFGIGVKLNHSSESGG